MKNYVKRQSGFTLIELIVVIAIMGVLAAIAVPTVSNYLSSSKARSFEAEQARLQTAVDSYLSSTSNTKYLGRRQLPIIGRDQTDRVNLFKATSTATLKDDQEPFASTTDLVYWNPLGGVQGGTLTSSSSSSVWVDGGSDGFRDTPGASSLDGWTTIPVTQGSNTYYVDPRYYFIDFETLVTLGILNEIPDSASPDNMPNGSTETYDGSYIWYIDADGKVQALSRSFPSYSGFQTGVFP